MKQKENKKSYHNLDVEKERLKELSLINQIAGILKKNKNLDETLQRIVSIMPRGWQNPEAVSVRIVYDNKEFKSNDFFEEGWSQKQIFRTENGKFGNIEVFYKNKFPDAVELQCLPEERDMITNIANVLKRYINDKTGNIVIKKFGYSYKKEELDLAKEQCTITSGQLMQRFMNKYSTNRDIFHDLTPFKVKEILLVASLYDTYSIEKEGRFSEHMLGPYAQLNLTSLPRITAVSTMEEAFEQLYSKHFDMIIIMVGTDKKTPSILSRKFKKVFPYIPIFLLLNNNSDIVLFQRKRKPHSFDRIFVWNGESKIFFAMIKLLEDSINVDNDTRKGLVRVILVVEDSPMFYSRYIPLLYQVVLEQTKRIIDDVSSDDLYKVLKLRARPKILLATNYEEAISIYKKYKDYLLCLISDVKFSKNGRINENSGFELVEKIRTEKKDLPVIIQSSSKDNEVKAGKLKATFIYKNSESLAQDFKSFILNYLGFGNFLFKDGSGKSLVVARTLKDFEKYLKEVPVDSILYHASRDHFSLWLMARSEIQAAKILHTKKTSDFKDAESIRQYLISILSKFRHEKFEGQIVPFDESAGFQKSNIVLLTEGAMGGKGRGLAFINALIYNFDFSYYVPGINISTPRTAFIGTDEFESFLDRNELHFVTTEDIPLDELKERFLKTNLSDYLIDRLRVLLEHFKKPLAIRSSGLFEDSLMQPFAGIFETYILPNNHPDLQVRLKQLVNAIKLVYASVYSDVARGYIAAVNYKIEEEKMAVIIQEVVGNKYNDVFYPHISGVAQSYNYYPFSHMKPEEGVAVAAIGLGKYVVEGEKAYRFSPKYPKIDFMSTEDQVKNSQVQFYAVNLDNQNPDLMLGEDASLIKLDIYDAEKYETLKHCASVYNADNNTIDPGLSKPGSRVVNFANILKYNYIPMARTIEVILDVVKEAMGSPVEIEFAVDLDKDTEGKASFYILQVKPMIGAMADYNVNMDKINKEDIILYAEKGMGNGQIKHITDIIYVDPKKFDKSKTEEMANEINELNKAMVKSKKHYVLIGPGRWGTRDKWIGIPVRWPQISHAKVIVETSLEDYPLDASSGSHFFHNVTSMNVGYLSVQPEMSNSFINYDILNSTEIVNETKFFKHIRFQKPVVIKMDGKKRIAVITVK
jgi:hypothetical protein